jgi:hypothetical protein
LSFSPRVGPLDHLRVESGTGHDREVLAIHRSGVHWAAAPVQADPDRFGDVGRYPKTRRQQVRRASRDDRERDL